MANAASSSKPPPKPPVVQPSSGNAIIINPCQRLNPILECIRNVSKEFGDIVPDFQLGRTTCALYLSLKYHRLHPEYVHQRIERLGNTYSLRILLLMCDISQHQDAIRELTKTCLINNMTIIVAWTPEEAGTYLATYKAFEHKPPDIIKERVDKDYGSVLRSALTSVSKVNKTDVEGLRTSFGSFANIAKATPEQLQQIPGFGQVKVRRLKDAFEKPFRNNATSSLSGAPAQTQTQLQPPAAARQPSQTRSVGGESSASRGAAAGKTREKGWKPFGSAADMPPPPSPPQARGPFAERVDSPQWDIELDLDDDDGPLIGSTEANGESASGDGRPFENAEGAVETNENEEMARRKRKRPPSPVWDIELDLNDSD